MKKTILLPLLLWILQVHAQNVGIGTNNPVQKLDINGAIKIGSDGNTTPIAGSIRWNAASQDFEGYNGSNWISLTAGRSGIGSMESQVMPTGIIDPIITTGPDGTYGAAFGEKIAGYGERLLVSARTTTYLPGSGSQVLRAGSIHVYDKINGQYSVASRIWAPLRANQTYFGTSIAIDSSHFVVGELTKTANGLVGGKIHVYASTPLPSLEASLLPNDPADDDYFGQSVALSGSRIAAGAPGKRVSGSTDRGKVYLYEKQSGSWVLKQSLIATDGISNARFGESVAMKGGYMAVGAPNKQGTGYTGTGKVYIYNYNPTLQSWIATKILLPEENESYPGFGSVVKMPSDDTLLVVENYMDSYRDAKVYVYTRSGVTWTRQSVITVQGGPIGKKVDADLQGPELLVSLTGGYVNGRSTGKAFLYRFYSQAWHLTRVLVADQRQPFTSFGYSVKIVNDRLLVGASQDSGSSINSGLVYEYLRQ